MSNDQPSVEGKQTMPVVQPEQHGRIFQEIVVEYPSYCIYPKYKGKPYFLIKYTENGQEFIGYATYKPEALSEYLKEYFIPSVQPQAEKESRMTRKDILDAAEKIVTGERQQTYGEPEENFETIAQMWEAYLGVPISGMDVSMMMVLLKVARVSGATDRTSLDNFVDICGYASCGGEIAHQEGRIAGSNPKKERDEDIWKKRIAEMDVTKIIDNIRHSRETEGRIARSNPKKEHTETHACDDPNKKVSVQDQDMLINVSKGQDPYSVIGNYISNHVTVIEDMIAIIRINGVIIKELYMVDVDADGYFYWKSDWWEGEEDVALLDFFPVSDAERETDKDICIQIPDPDRVIKARSKWEDKE